MSGADRKRVEASGWIAVSGAALGWLLVFFYLGLNINMAPDQVDGALVLSSIHDVSEGQGVFWDFIDIYGPIHWFFPALFYSWAGQQVWGVRLWLLLIKLLSVALCYLLTKRLADRFHAWMSAVLMTVLLGLPWHALQIPYAALHCLPYLLGSWYLLFCRPLRLKWLNHVLAGLLTAAALWIKISSGAFLLAGGVFYCLYWLPRTFEQSGPGKPDNRAAAWFRGVQVIGLICYAAVFYYFAYEISDWLFVLYLQLPFALTLVWTLRRVWIADERDTDFAERLGALAAYGATSVCLALVFGLFYFGFEGGKRYAAEIWNLILHTSYWHRVPAVGEPGYYPGFNEYYWNQFPWLITILFCLWWALQRNGGGERTFGLRWVASRNDLSGLWAAINFHMFVLYSFGDETHTLLAIFPAVPIFFVILSQIEKLAVARVRGLRPAGLIRVGLSIALFAWFSTLTFRPRADALSWSEGDWTSSPRIGEQESRNRLRYLRFSAENNPAVKDRKTEITNHEWDAQINQASMYIDEITRDGEEVLVLCPNQLLTFHSHTRQAGGRYRYLFYLVKFRVMSRRSFLAVVPFDDMVDIFRNPPRVAVSEEGVQALVEAFPEFGFMLDRYYELTRTFSELRVYRRRDTLDAPSEDGIER